MNRFALEDTAEQAIIKMADGNPGALTVMMSLMSGGAGPGLAHIMWLDDLGIYGSDIWIAYKDVCRQDVAVLCEMLRHDRHGLKAAVEANKARG